MGVGRTPALAAGRIRADNVIVGQNMMITQRFGCLGEVANDRRVGADFGLWKNDSKTHTCLLMLDLAEVYLALVFCKGDAQIDKRRIIPNKVRGLATQT